MIVQIIVVMKRMNSLEKKLISSKEETDEFLKKIKENMDKMMFEISKLKFNKKNIRLIS